MNSLAPSPYLFPSLLFLFSPLFSFPFCFSFPFPSCLFLKNLFTLIHNISGNSETLDKQKIEQPKIKIAKLDSKMR